MSTTERYFLTYRGVSLPLQLTQELPPEALRNRNTYLRAQYDERGRLVRCDKLVYGDVEMTHVYVWGDDDRLRQATVTLGDEEPRVLTFD